MVADRRVRIGAIHTYLELFGRYFVDLTPDIALVAADAADHHGNLYTGANTEETPVIVEATAFVRPATGYFPGVDISDERGISIPPAGLAVRRYDRPSAA